MDIKMGVPVEATDGRAGKVEQLIYDPGKNEVAGVVVTQGWLLPHDVVLPIDRVESADEHALRVRATVDSRYYEGSYPWVTGVVGASAGDEEVLLLGHTSEQGAQDNATGVAAMIEAVAACNRLIVEGKLARPRRSIREAKATLGMNCASTLSQSSPKTSR